MKKYAVLIVALVMCGGLIYWFVTHGGTSDVTLTPGSSFAGDGHIVKDGAGLKPGVWYLSYEKAGAATNTELVFSNESVCAGKTASGQCQPSLFIKGRAAHVEGIVSDGSVRVSRMTFTEPVKTK